MEGFIPVTNTRFRTNHRKHHRVVCPVCNVYSKNIKLHYKKYHDEINKEFERMIMGGEIGELYGVKFVTDEK